MEAAGPDPASSSVQLRRRAEQWIARLGADRMVLAVPSDAGPQHPLVELAGQRALPVFRVGAVGWARSPFGCTAMHRGYTTRPHYASCLGATQEKARVNEQERTRREA